MSHSACIYLTMCTLFLPYSTWFSAISILSRQEELNKLRRKKSDERSKVNDYMQLERTFFEKRSEKEKLVTRLKLLRAKLEELQSPQKEGHTSPSLYVPVCTCTCNFVFSL